MSNQLEKLKNSIKKEYSKNFELNLMKSSGFIPVDKRQTDFWVILNKGNSANKTQVENVILRHLGRLLETGDQRWQHLVRPTRVV